jgi:DNA-binding CsgD family transcriptional regulator
LEFIDTQTVLVNHEYKGVFKLDLDEDLTKVENYTTIQSIEKGLFSSMVKYQDKILYAYKGGVFCYDTEKSVFEKDPSLSKLYQPDNFSSGKMVKTEDNKLWLFNQTDVINVTTSSLKDQYIISRFPISVEARHQISGYENVSLVDPDTYLFGKSNGYLRINTTDKFEPEANIYITQISVKNKDNKEVENFDLSKISNKNNNLSFKLSAFNFNPLSKIEYQYKLTGYNEQWSEWQEDTQINLRNLPFGKYVLNARSRIGENNLSDTIQLEFYIEKPFYLTSYMVLLYIFTIILMGFLIHFLYKSYYKKQKISIQKEADRKLQLKELEAQKEIMDVNNKKLKLDIENKNRELAISTMSLIKKNEFLSKIKTDLKSLKTTNNVAKKVIKSIDKNINSQDDWQFFEEAFNNADKDFFKKLKESHPALTHNDFKLCAYLRLNLSSKEIAPLFNISTKSVEIKRYRLRKKMNLDRDQSLTDYILGI